MVKKITWLSIFIISFCVTFTGCNTQANGSANRDANAPEVGLDAFECDYEHSKYGDLIQIDPLSACTKDGRYELSWIFEKSVNITYTDFATEQTIFFCRQPGCTHNNDSCPSYIVLDDGYAPLIHTTGEILILVRPAATESINPYLKIRDLDGSNERYLTKFDSNQTLGMHYFSDNRYLFVDVRETTSDGDPRYLLKEIDLLTGECLQTVDLTRDDGYFCMVDSYKNQLVFEYIRFESMECELYLVDPNDFSFDRKIMSYHMVNDRVFVLGGYLFTYIMQDKEICRTNIDTGEVLRMDVPRVPKELYSSIQPAYDGKIYYEYAQSSSTEEPDDFNFIVDIASGTMTELTLRIPNSTRFVTPISDYGDSLYVIMGALEKEIVTEDENGDMITFTTGSLEYGFISKEDFENNTPNFRPITSKLGI